MSAQREKVMSSEELEKMFSDFGKEFSIDIPCITKALDHIMIEYLFSFQERKIELTDWQYDNIHYLNMVRSYLSKKLIEYAAGQKNRS
jgi:hypothetical protein